VGKKERGEEGGGEKKTVYYSLKRPFARVYNREKKREGKGGEKTEHNEFHE